MSKNALNHLKTQIKIKILHLTNTKKNTKEFLKIQDSFKKIKP